MKFDSYGEPLNQKPIKMTAIIDVVRSTSDGGAKITLECGAEASEAIQEFMRLKMMGDVLLAVACVPYKEP